jgi:hypothetical protein
MSPAPPGAAFFELVRADPGRSLEAACDALVALPASLACCSGLSLATLASAVASTLAEGGASAHGPLDYMREAGNAVEPSIALHYLGRALEVRAWCGPRERILLGREISDDWGPMGEPFFRRGVPALVHASRQWMRPKMGPYCSRMRSGDALRPGHALFSEAALLPSFIFFCRIEPLPAVNCSSPRRGRAGGRTATRSPLKDSGVVTL